MHVFQIKGFSGLLMFGVALLLTALLVLVLPALFMMTLWNAVVFEGFSGPEVGASQGLLLWMMTLVLFKLVFRPEISFQFHQVNDPPDLDQQ